MLTCEKGWRGYIFSREIGGQMIPHRVQNLVIRDYTAKQNIQYLLSAVEYAMPGCFMILEALIEEQETVDGLVFYSTHMLPPEPLRRNLFSSFISSGKGVRFALENITVTTPEDAVEIEDLIMCRRLQRNSINLG